MNLLEKMNKILDKEGECLLAGNYEELEWLAEKKHELKWHIDNQLKNINQEALAAVVVKAKRNEALLESARRGIRSAMSHMREASEDSFKSYSKEGSRSAWSKSMKLRQKV